MQYTVEMRDDQCSHTVEIEADSHSHADTLAREACQEWAEEGDWGDDGAEVIVCYTVSVEMPEIAEDDDEQEDIGAADLVTSEGTVCVEIKPDHDALIKAAGGDHDCDHDWTSEGEGGCTENPGVWSTGGTSLVFHTHCRTCGLKRVERSTGSQRNPGEHDTVEYTQPDSWCAECQHEECECPSNYTLVSTEGGYAVRRENGDLAEFVDSDEADEAKKLLDSGSKIEDDYEWTEE